MGKSIIALVKLFKLLLLIKFWKILLVIAVSCLVIVMIRHVMKKRKANSQ